MLGGCEQEAGGCGLEGLAIMMGLSKAVTSGQEIVGSIREVVGSCQDIVGRVGKMASSRLIQYQQSLSEAGFGR